MITNENVSSEGIILETLRLFYKIYSPSVVVLFCISGLTASKQLVNIRQKINQLIADKPADMVHQVDKLWQYYFMNLEFIYQINRCFGAVLLWEILNDFVAVTLSIAYFLIGLTNTVNWITLLSTVMFFSVTLINLSGIILVADNITQQVKTEHHFD